MAGADRMPIEEVVRKVLVDEHADVLRESVRWLARELMEVEVSELIGAERGERTEDRATHRNGYRPRRWDTRAGEIELQIPKIRQGSYFPSFLQPRKRSEQALLSVVQQAYVCGVSTRRVDQLVESLGLRVSQSRSAGSARGWTSRSRRSARGRWRAATSICFSTPRSRRSETAAGCSASAWSSPTACTRPAGGRSSAWTSARPRPRRSGGVPQGLVARGLVGVQLVISDAHEGLKNAIAKVLGAPWQRCTVHFLRDCLGHARRDQHGLLAALIRPIFNAETPAAARDKLSEARRHAGGHAAQGRRRCSRQAEDDILAFYAFPADHWRKLRSTNPLERFNREIGRRTDVVGIFPDDRSLIRLASMLAIEQNDEWLVGRRYLSAASMGPLLEERPHRHTATRRSSSSNRPEQPTPSPTT